jgi:hypothetical protein
LERGGSSVWKQSWKCDEFARQFNVAAVVVEQVNLMIGEIGQPNVAHGFVVIR